MVKYAEKIASYSTNGLIGAVKMMKPKTPEERVIRGMVLQEIEKRKGPEFVDNLMDSLYP